MDIIKNTPIQQLMDDVGMCLIDNDINVVLGDSERSREAKEKLREISVKNEKQLKKLKQIKDSTIPEFMTSDDAIHELNRSAVEQIFFEYEDIINKRAYVLLSLYNTYKRYEQTTADIGLKRYIYTTLQAGLRYIGASNFTVISPQNAEKDFFIKNIKVVNSVELVNAIKKGKSYDATQNSSKKKNLRLEDIDRQIMLVNVFQVLRQEDVGDCICTNANVANAMLYQIVWNSIIRYIKNHPESNLKCEDVIEEKDIEKYEAVWDSKEYVDTFIGVIKQNSKYVDIDRLLLICAYRYLEKLEITDEILTEDNINLIHYTLNYIIGEVKEGTSLEKIFIDEDEYTQYSLEQLETDIFRFVAGRYIKKSESEDLKYRLIANEIQLNDVPKEELMLLTMKGEELCKLVDNSDENAMYLIDNNIVQSEDMVVFLSVLENCSQKLFLFLCERKMLSIEQIAELYENGIISAEYIANIQDEELLKDINSYGTKNFRELFSNVLKGEKEEEETSLELFSKYATLYKVLNLSGKSEEEHFEEAFKLISSFDDIDGEMLQELYQLGIIPLESAVDWGVNLIDMLSTNSLKPTDLKKLYGKDIISIEDIRNVILNGGLLYEEKLDLIYSTFDGDSEKEQAIREELVELLETGESYRTNANVKRGKGTNEPTIKSREFITDPHARWKLISLLDKDYSKKFLPAGKEIMDGHRVFLLPNQDKIVIEKMHEKRYGRKVSAYGSATYIMDTEEFFKNMEVIIVDGAINRTALRELYEGDKAARITHTLNWGEYVKKYFDINPENEKYTEEDIIAIDKAILSVVNSRKERE